ncbi:MAG: tetratricopeptide repeat protein [Kutzneria sp.]|nr:tetratricopeptide repeat protein [Kutzneria sp.]
MAAASRAEHFFQQGKNFFAQKDYPRATEAFDAAIRLAPDVPNSQFLLGVSRVRSGDVPGALVPLARCVYLEPEHPDGLNALAMTLRWLGRDDDAVIHLARAAYLGNLQAPDTLAAMGMDFCRTCSGPVRLSDTASAGGACPRCAGEPRTLTSPRLRMWPFARLPEDDWRSRLSLPREELSELGLQYLEWHRHGSENRGIDQAIMYLELAAASTEADTEYPIQLSHLGVAYRERFGHHGLSTDLEYAIDCLSRRTRWPFPKSPSRD